MNDDLRELEFALKDWANDDVLSLAVYDVQPLIAKLEAVRAVLAPLLDDPWTGEGRCAWCGCWETERHGDDCPTRIADALLGRSPDAV